MGVHDDTMQHVLELGCLDGFLDHFMVDRFWLGLTSKVQNDVGGRCVVVVDGGGRRVVVGGGGGVVVNG